MVLEYLNRLPDFGLGVIETGDIWGIIILVMWLIILIALCAMLGYITFLFSVYRYEVGIFSKRGKSWIFVKDRARIKRGREGKKMIFFKTKGKSVVPPELKYEIPKKALLFSLFSPSIIFFEQYGRENFAPLSLEDSVNPGGVTLNPTEMHIDNWANAELWNIHRKYSKQDFISKYGPALAIGMIAFMMIVTTFLIMNGLKDIGSAIASASQTLSEGLKTAKAAAPGGLG